MGFNRQRDILWVKGREIQRERGIWGYYVQQRDISEVISLNIESERQEEGVIVSGLVRESHPWLGVQIDK